MTYNPLVPEVTSSPLLSCPLIQANYSVFSTAFSTLTDNINYNHMPLNDPNQGKHGAVMLQTQTGTIPIDGNSVSLFAMDQTFMTGGTQPQLTYQTPKFLPSDQVPFHIPSFPIPLTYNTVSNSGPIYQSFLQGGYILYFGQVTFASLLPVTITLTPKPTEVLNVQVFPVAYTHPDAATYYVSVQQPTGVLNAIITINNLTSPFPITYSWLAIAKA